MWHGELSRIQMRLYSTILLGISGNTLRKLCTYLLDLNFLKRTPFGI